MNLLSYLATSSRRHLLATLATLALLFSVSPAMAEERETNFSQAELDQMLAPIALYPDTLLSQILIASTYPLEVIQADRWVRSNSDLKTEEALKFAEKKDWDPSVKALVAFPDVLKRMSEDTDWTQRLGDAFLDDEEQVMDTVQRLRKRAYANGNLEKAKHIRVENEENNIIIEPAEERVVYVPVYDTRVVYGNWWWADYPPVYWSYPSHYTYVSGFYWGPSIFIGSTYFYSSCRWSNRRVVVIDRHTHYVNEPHFYTGRSIVRYEGSREWRHDPGHRRGVAYYSDHQREAYNSRRESRQDDRAYRERQRAANNGNWDQNRNDGRNNDWHNNRDHDRNDTNRGRERNQMAVPANRMSVDNNINNNANNVNVNTTVNNNTQPVDRAEQFRTRMQNREQHRNENWRSDNNANPGQNNNANLGQGNNPGNAPVQLNRENSDRFNRPAQNTNVEPAQRGNFSVPEVRQDARQEARQESRQESRQEDRQERRFERVHENQQRVEMRNESRGGGNDSEQAGRDRAWKARQRDDK